MSRWLKPQDFPTPTESVLSYWFGEVAAAACALEARWTMRALRRVDAGLADRLKTQRDLFDQACVAGSDEELAEHGAAMCRGYAICAKALQEAQEPDDAYFEGLDAASGLRVLVGPHKAVARDRGDGAIWISPDEVAALLARQTGGLVAAIKAKWPGAEVV